MAALSLRAVLRNAAALYSLQAVNILIPLITFPYILRTVGIEPFGVFSFAVAIVQIGVLVAGFGFSLTATRRVAVARDDSQEALSREYSITMVLKAGLAVAVSVVLALFIAFVPILRERATLFVSLSPMLVGEALFAVWLLQGLEKMQYLPLFSLVSRSISLVLLLLLVDGPEDLVIVGATQSLPFLLNGLMTIWVARYRLGIGFHPLQRRTAYREAFSEARKAFGSQLAGQVYIRGPLPLLGFLASATHVGLYSVAQKIGALLTAVVVQPLSQSLYPQLCSQFERSVAAARPFRKMLLTWGSLGLAALLVALNLAAAPIIRLVTGGDSPEIVHLLRLYSLVVALSGMNSFLAILLMAMRRFGELSKILLVGSVLFCVMGFPLVYRHQSAGVVCTSILVELAVVVLLIRETSAGDS